MHRKKKTKDDEKGKRMRASSWTHFVEAHNFLAQQYFCPTEDVNRRKIYEFAMLGDIVAQAYISSLRKSVLSDIKEGQPAPYSYTETLLLNHIRRGNDILCELAKTGRSSACAELWEEALKLSKAF